MNRRLPRPARLLLRAACTLLALALLYLLAAAALGCVRLNTARPPVAESRITIYLLSNGLHTDIVMPLSNEWFDWRSLLGPQSASLAATHIAIGWGERAFYLETPTWAQARASTALKAISGLGRATLHITYLPHAPPATAHSPALPITPAEYLKLAQGIRPYFQTAPNGLARPIPASAYGETDAFYEAHGRYSLLSTCNTWTNARLRQAGLPAVAWTPFAQPLLQAWRAARADAATVNR
ncbi:TIGR02117 family protein [Ottowia cancrivicina]|uniref:TIGR02117 family protein n=1 Tax=Ottowia cancrivicina TaxID=3040346 RepID=A0AAW6RIY2_9BURK|nr:TIGR02117 family protein [Ottowia sp. 10c7w1]MDG9698918.1 TIGR02117 family protein [Ottowia sp. 10c7w1]